MSWTGTVIALGWLLIAFCFLRWLYLQDPTAEPDEVEIVRKGLFRWSYLIKDRPHSLRSGRYFTRGAALRAARQELKRLEKRIET